MVKNVADGLVIPDGQDGEKKDVIRDNAPRIVGAMKFVPDVFLFMSGLRDTGKAPFRSAAAIGFMTSRTMRLAYGSKDREKSSGQSDSPHQNDTSFTGKLKYNYYKVTHPSQYPVEAGAGVAALAGVSVALSGAAQMRRKATFVEGAIELGVGIFTALAEGNVLFSKEKAKKPSPAEKPDASKAPEAKNTLQKLKDQPVLLSGITQAAISGSQIVLGLMTLARSKKNPAEGKGKSWHYLAAASIYTAADLVYAFFVRKNEFNTEANKTPAPELQPHAGQKSPAVPVKQGEALRKLNWQQSVQQPDKTEGHLTLR